MQLDNCSSEGKKMLPMKERTVLLQDDTLKPEEKMDPIQRVAGDNDWRRDLEELPAFKEQRKQIEFTKDTHEGQCS
ncbi:hypothetical protein H920_15733 [Fukomys damarensis]|uniref:Uncharacterized protein n=1 Tax=Fukomys damarensis TaxID=885580 RepID=A0A091CTT5_FUKDA|nr:hypothetical protein H920_15733 [Fukomys damarensis]